MEDYIKYISYQIEWHENRNKECGYVRPPYDDNDEYTKEFMNEN